MEPHLPYPVLTADARDDRREVWDVVDVVVRVGVSDGDTGVKKPVNLSGQLGVDCALLGIGERSGRLCISLMEASSAHKSRNAHDLLRERRALGEVEMYADPVGEALLPRQRKSVVEEFAVRHDRGIGDQPLAESLRYRESAPLVHAEVVAVDDDPAHKIASCTLMYEYCNT